MASKTTEGFGFHTETCDYNGTVQRVTGDAGGIGAIRKVGARAWEARGQQVWPPAKNTLVWPTAFDAMCDVIRQAQAVGLVADL